MPNPKRSYNLLVVEDNEGDAHLIREAFRECGFDCLLHFAESTGSAVGILQAQHIDIILSDMSIRTVEGDSFLQIVRSDPRWKTIPVIVLSGSYNSHPAYEAGANAFILKSMDMDEFFSKIKSLMHFWVHIAELPARPFVHS